jgi:hypothetical protein
MTVQVHIEPEVHIGLRNNYFGVKNFLYAERDILKVSILKF